ncbi:hypothetical protein NST02_18390 [Robertmurraya sp. FSL W8-0741]|uniref:hypothetical protein n=1 Tax=Robertmurraya sp. FSL W8-0741 TaxID=2954629 RepID=UPI0030F4BD2F
MNIKELFNSYKNGDSTEKLGIISNLVTIFTAITALITGQLLTLKFVISNTTFIAIAFYIIAMGISLLIFFYYLKGSAILLKTYKSFLVQVSMILIATGALIFAWVIIWSFILTFSY